MEKGRFHETVSTRNTSDSSHVPELETSENIPSIILSWRPATMSAAAIDKDATNLHS